MADPNTGMSKAEMKRMLTHSKEEPVNCAIGQGDDQAVGLMVLHRSKSGAACAKQLRDEFPKARNVRWGTAFVDMEDNPKQVKLTLNSAVSGMARRLAKTLKGTGFSKVVMVLEDGSAVESADDEEEASAPAAGAPPAPPGGPQSAAGPTAAEKAEQASALQKQLAALVPAIPKAAGTDEARKAVLMKLATDANVNLKTGNLAYAANFIDQLRIALEAKQEPASLQTLSSSRQAWTGTQAKVRAEVEKLRGELQKTYAGEAFAADITAQFKARVDPVVSKFDDRLLDVLQDIMDTKDPAAREALTTQGRGLVKEYLSFAMSEKLIADLDANPFVPLNIKGTVTATLAALAKAIH